MKHITPRWAIRWLEIAVIVFIGTILLCTPFVPLVWWLWNWIAVTKFGAPHMSLIDAAGGLFLLRFLQASVALTQPAEKEQRL